MDILNIAAILVTVSALFSYINYRFIKLPNTIGLMVIALLFSLLLVLLEKLGISNIADLAERTLRSIDFNETLMQGMLSYLLFAGALHINLNELAEQKWIVAILATVGVIGSTFIIGYGSYLLLHLLGIELALIYCLLFGALISPTDPIAVLGILKSAGAPRSLEIKFAGESLFNDGVAVVVFLVLLGIATGGEQVNAAEIAWLFAKEALGGILFGLLLGWGVYRLVSHVDDYLVEILLTLALVMGGYALATALHVSAPIAIVVAGLLIGNHGRHLGMSEHTRERLDSFWELIDEILNAVLFVLIGLEVLILPFSISTLLAGLLLIPLVLASRFISVGIPVTLMRTRRRFSPGGIRILTWGGLRGGISVALALTLPLGEARDTLLAITYLIVVFSILVQGLTIGRLVRRLESR